MPKTDSYPVTIKKDECGLEQVNCKRTDMKCFVFASSLILLKIRAEQLLVFDVDVDIAAEI